MKQREILLNTPSQIDSNDEDHFSASTKTPIRDDAFDVADDKKIEKIAHHFKSIMDILGLDLNDDSLSGTPLRVAKMYVNETFSGLNPGNKPIVRLFDNKYAYNQMLVEKNIKFYSYCEHHFVPIHGVAHVAYIPTDKVIGLSKINRTVHYYAKRPQVQERLTMQIAEDLKRTLGTENVAIIIDAKHLCVAARGVRDADSLTTTAVFGGEFEKENFKKEFFNYINKEPLEKQ